MNHFAHFLAILGFVTLIGCGSSSQVAERPAAEAASATQTATLSSPADVVSQFLDEIRRGGKDSNANDLLTVRARSELNRIGQAIQPIGSPNARFLVTRAETVPGEETSALVHSIWSEPNVDGTKTDFQVVWALQQEQADWRISGLAMELEPNEDPLIIDFENAELMAKLLSPPARPQIGSGAESQESAPNSTIAR
jgi:hypothetical protein